MFAASAKANPVAHGNPTFTASSGRRRQALSGQSLSQRRLTLIVPEGAAWGVRDYRPSESVTVPGVNVTLSVDELYGAVLRP